MHASTGQKGHQTMSWGPPPTVLLGGQAPRGEEPDPGDGFGGQWEAVPDGLLRQWREGRQGPHPVPGTPDGLVPGEDGVNLERRKVADIFWVFEYSVTIVDERQKRFASALRQISMRLGLVLKQLFFIICGKIWIFNYHIKDGHLVLNHIN